MDPRGAGRSTSERQVESLAVECLPLTRYRDAKACCMLFSLDRPACSHVQTVPSTCLDGLGGVLESGKGMFGRGKGYGARVHRDGGGGTVQARGA